MYEGIKEIVRLTSELQVNKHLADGWKLLHINTVSVASMGSIHQMTDKTVYVVGR